MIGELILSSNTINQGRISLNTAFSGTAEFNNISIDSTGNFSGGTGGGVIYSGGTDLYNIFLTTNGGNDITRVQPGIGISTGGTANEPVINLDSSISLTAMSADTIYSGSTDLSSIFLTTNDGNDITRVQPGTNIATGGTANEPIINLDTNITLTSVSATSISADTIYSGSTDLSSLIGTGGGGGVSAVYDFGLEAGGVNWDISSFSPNAKITLTGDVTSLNVTSLSSGQFGTLEAIQGGGGGYSLAFGFGTHRTINGGGGNVTLTATAGAIDILSFFYDGSVFFWNVGNDYT